VVWQDGAQGDTSSLAPVLLGLGGSEPQLSFIENLLQPLLLSMVCEAMRNLPDDPAFFCLEWLLTYLEAPDLVNRAVLKWQQKRRKYEGVFTGDESPDSVRSPSVSSANRINEDMGLLRSILSEDMGLQRTILSEDMGLQGSCEDMSPHKSSLKGKSPARRSESRKATINEAAEEIRPELQRLATAKGAESYRERDSSRSPRGDAPDSHPWRRCAKPRRSSVRIVVPALGEIEQMLAGVKSLAALDDADRTAVAKMCVVRQFDAQAEIMKYGDVSSDLFVVMSGSCRVSVPEYKNTLHPGDCFNEASILKGEVAAEAMYEAAPDTDVQLLSVNIKDMESLGCWKKCLKKQKRVTESHIIARPDVQRGGGGGGAERTTPGFRRGFSAASLCEEKDEVPRQDTAEMPDDTAEYQKTEQDLEHIRVSVSRNQLTELLQLSEEQISELAHKVYLKEYPAHTVVIKKGDQGEHFYIVREGAAEVVTNPDPENPMKSLGGTPPIQFWSGSSFGELALLYNCQRKATVVTIRPTSLWVLDLTGWRYILEKMPTSRIEAYVGMLNNVDALTALIPQSDKRVALADCLEEVYYQNGERVVFEGMIGFTLYIVLDGTCSATSEEGAHRRLKMGDHFGEASLFNGEPYLETITVTSEHATILQLDRETCSQLKLGLEFQGGDGDNFTQVTTRKLSLLHMATTNFSNAQSFRLDQARREIPHSRLEQVGVLGCGAFAQVSLVHDPESDTLYALKALSKAAIDEQNLQTVVICERNALAELSDSPFVVRLITTYKDINCIYLLMEPALGGELFALYADLDWYGSCASIVARFTHCVFACIVALFSSRSEDKASFFAACVALGIDHIHSKKIIHRDIKLENILVDEKGYGKITDLGIAKVVIGKTYTVCGTSDYLAPETLKQAGHNRAVDWWALGIMVFAMMAGRMPFDADDVLQIYKNIVKGFRKELFPSSFNDCLVEFVKGLCRKKPQERLAMLTGGIRNVAQHPWMTPGGDTERWQRIATRKYQTAWEPALATVEQRRATMKQIWDEPFKDYYGEGGEEWDACF